MAVEGGVNGELVVRVTASRMRRATFDPSKKRRSTDASASANIIANPINSSCHACLDFTNFCHLFGRSLEGVW